MGGTSLSDLGSDQLRGAVLYSERLLGLRHEECPLCGGWEDSTGWLLYREDAGPCRWYVDFRCAGCGSRGGVWKREWQSLLDEVLGAGAD